MLAENGFLEENLDRFMQGKGKKWESEDAAIISRQLYWSFRSVTYLSFAFQFKLDRIRLSIRV
jgi:hypothetical protein